jgi:hypothetical protein
MYGGSPLAVAVEPLMVWSEGWVTEWVSEAEGPSVVPGLLALVGFSVLCPELRIEPPVAVLVMMCVPVVLAVVPPWHR